MQINTISKASVNRTTLSDGLMPTASAERFIQMIFDSTPLLKAIRTKVMKAEKETLAGWLESKSQTRIVGVNNSGNQGAIDSEDQSAYRRTMSDYKFTLNTYEYSLSRTVSNKVLTDNIEGQSFGSQIASNLANMVRVDLEDVAINGYDVDPTGSLSETINGAHTDSVTTIDIGTDVATAGFPSATDGKGYLAINDGSNNIELVTYTGTSGDTFTGCTRGVADPDLGITTPASAYSGGEALTWQRHHLLGRDDGFIRIFESPHTGMQGSNTVDGSAINSGAISFNHFNEVRKALPKKYRGKELIYLMGGDQFEKYRSWLITNGSTITQDKVMGDPTYYLSNGQTIMTPMDFPESKMLLTTPKNLIFGIYNAIKMRKVTAETDSTLADTDETYYNLRLRAGYTVERTDAGVLCTGLTV